METMSSEENLDPVNKGFDEPRQIGQTYHNPNIFSHFERLRLNNLFMRAVEYPLILVCAGAGYGKTTAVYDFAKKHQANTIWIQLSEYDNAGTHFWENYIRSVELVNEYFAIRIKSIGFPDTVDKLNQYLVLAYNHLNVKRQIIVMDDFHLIDNPAVIGFVE